MEQKNRGTYKVNPNKTPKENVVSLLAMIAPMDTTLAKMTGTLEVKEDDNVPYWRRRADTLRLNEVNVFPTSRSRWSECSEIKDFHRVAFQTKTSRKHTYSKNMLRSVPVVKGKISLTKVTRLLTQFAEYNKEYEKEQEAERIEQERRDALRKVNEKRIVDLRNMLKLPRCVGLNYTGYREEEKKKFDISISDLKEEQVVAIATAIKEALKKHKVVEEVVEGAE
jgi:hypothetical protein